jgi:hypothetical protein
MASTKVLAVSDSSCPGGVFLRLLDGLKPLVERQKFYARRRLW